VGGAAGRLLEATMQQLKQTRGWIAGGLKRMRSTTLALSLT
jgi:hypothetical protein